MEHTKVFEVEVNDTVYYVSSTAKHKLVADLNNCEIPHTRIAEISRKLLEIPLTIYELISTIDHETAQLT